MTSNNPPLRMTPRGYPIVRALAAFPVACFTCALLTDIAYLETTRVMWVDFSDWLLAVGMAGGVLAGVAGLFGLAFNRDRGAARPVWPIVLGGVLVLASALLDNLVHSRDGWTSVMPFGLLLSVVTVLLMLGTAVAAVVTRRRASLDWAYDGVRP
ncbi:MAG: DUF2231 domain-containing protein [Acetobacteraceae bacterium]|nr:DUF2231 domain-containing protein [Acetobacteraceae bacterium]